VGRRAREESLRGLRLDALPPELVVLDIEDVVDVEGRLRRLLDAVVSVGAATRW